MEEVHYNKNNIFPSNITEDEQFLLGAYDRLASAQRALKQIREYKKIQLIEQKNIKAKSSSLNSAKITAKSNTDAIKKLVQAGKLSLGNNSTSGKPTFRRRNQNKVVPKAQPTAPASSENSNQPLLQKRAPNPEHEKIKVYCGPGVTEEKIHHVFGQFGTITDVRCVGRGPQPDTALVHFEDLRAAVNAVKTMHDSTHDLFVAKLTVTYTRRQSETIKRVFERKENKTERYDPSAGRKMVVYEDETDLFD